MNELAQTIRQDPALQDVTGVAVTVVALLIVWAVSKRIVRSIHMVPGTGKDDVIVYWNKTEALTVDQLVRGGIAVMGATGAGKTSGMQPIARGILRQPKSALLVLCSKPGEAQDWIQLLKEEGRSDDLVHMHIKSEHRVNLLEYERERCDGIGAAGNMTRFIMDMRKSIFRQAESKGGDSEYWDRQGERAIGHAITLLVLGGEVVDPVSIQNILQTAPSDMVQRRSTEFHESYICRVADKAFLSVGGTDNEHDYWQAAKFYSDEWPKLGDRTQGSIMSVAMSIIGVMTKGVVYERFFSKTNITPRQCIEQGKILLVDLPPDQYGSDLGYVANLGLKLCWQRTVLNQDINKHKNLAGVWGDEGNLWMSSDDSEHLARARSNRGFMVYMCQSYPAYLNMLPQGRAESTLDALMANFTCKIFFALGDHSTAEWASKLVGEETKVMFNGGRNQPDQFTWNPFQPTYGASSAGYSESFQPIIRPEELINGLRTGGNENGRIIDAYVMRSGVPFQNGYNVMPITVQQGKRNG